MRAEHVELYTDADGHTRWRWRAGNAKTVGDSSEGYTDSRRCREQAARLADALGVPLVDHRR